MGCAGGEGMMRSAEACFFCTAVLFRVSHLSPVLIFPIHLHFIPSLGAVVFSLSIC